MFKPFDILKVVFKISCLLPPNNRNNCWLYNASTAFPILIMNFVSLLFIPSSIIMMQTISNIGIFHLFQAFMSISLSLQIWQLIGKRRKLIEIIACIQKSYDEAENADEQKAICEQKSLRLFYIIILSSLPSFTAGVFISEKFNTEDYIEANRIFGRKNPEKLIAYMPWVPYDYTVAPYYQLTRLIMCLGCVVVSYILFLRLSLMSVMVYYINGLFDLIILRILSLPNHSNKSKTEKELEDIIESHQRILRISNDIVEFFRPIILVKTIFYFWILADIMLILTAEPFGTGIFIVCCFALLSCGYELLLDCWSGQQLADKSEEIGAAAYQCQWHEMTCRARKNILLLIRRAQRPVQLDAKPNIIPMTFKTYVQILKTSFSCYTLLQKIRSGKRIEG